MPLTEITFTGKDPVYNRFAEEIVKKINQFTGKTAVFEKLDLQNYNTYSRILYWYDHFTIIFSEVGCGTFDVIIHGSEATEKNTFEALKLYDDLFDFCANYLKKQNVSLFLSVSMYRFGEYEVGNDDCDGASHFANFKRRRKALPLTDELEALQEVAETMAAYFPVKYEGGIIETGKGKFRKQHPWGVVDQGGTAKIGVYSDELVTTIQTKKDVQDLLELKKNRMKELDQVKQRAIKELSAKDPAFFYDGKNGVVFLGNKATINTEYDVFKREYWMVFLKSKVKAGTLAELNRKIDKLIVKKSK